MQYSYMGKLIRVVNESTIDADLNLGFGIRYSIRLPLSGIKIETNSTSKEKVKDYIEKTLKDKSLAFKIHRDNQGIYNAIVFYKNNKKKEMINLNGELLKNGMAQSYPLKEKDDR